jgi:DNA-binding MarR family transcriptional regulator
MPLAAIQTFPLPDQGHGDADRLLDFIFVAGGAFRRLRGLLDEQVRPFNLLGAECLVLWLCDTRAHHAGWAQQDLASAIGVSPAQMSSLVEGLRKRGLMEMKRSPVDRRRQVWQLLSQGEDLLNQIRANLGTVAEQMNDLVPVPEQQGARELLARLAEPFRTGPPPLRSFDPDGLCRATETATTEQGGGK